MLALVNEVVIEVAVPDVSLWYALSSLIALNTCSAFVSQLLFDYDLTGTVLALYCLCTVTFGSSLFSLRSVRLTPSREHAAVLAPRQLSAEHS